MIKFVVRTKLIVITILHEKKNNSLNFTELFKNCGYRCFANEVNENVQNF